MGENSAIDWCDHTFNPWWGCARVSAGCEHCYAETLDHRFGGGHWGGRRWVRLIETASLTVTRVEARRLDRIARTAEPRIPRRRLARSIDAQRRTFRRLGVPCPNSTARGVVAALREVQP